MVEGGYMIEYCNAVYLHELLVAVMLLCAMWVPTVCKALYRIGYNLLYIAKRLIRRYF